MDKGTVGLGGQASTDEAASIEREIEVIRGNLDGLVTELDHRRHLLNPIAAARRHPSAFAVAGILVAGAITAAVLIHNARERRRNSWLGRGRRLKAAVTDLMEGKTTPVTPKVGRRVLGAVATAAAGMLGKRLATQLFARNG
jgi:hypothetical protein